MLLVVKDGQIAGCEPWQRHPVNEGKLCIKGWNAHQFIDHPDRLTKPLIRKGDEFKEASWDEALTLIAGKLTAIKEQSGPDAIAFLSSARCTNEENYLLQKLARAVIGTNNVDHCARL
jgi:formate dehydrogenase major subunit